MRREAFETYATVILPFTLRRRPLVEERAAVLTLWAELIPVMAPPWPCTLGRIGPNDRFRAVFHSFAFDRNASQLAPVQPELTSESCILPDELDVCVSFLRFATLRKVVDTAASPRFLTADDRRSLCTAVALAASRVACAPTREDHRVPGSRRGLPWFRLDDEMESSDEDRDDGVPRPVEELLLTAAEFICGNWDAVAPPRCVIASGRRPTVGDAAGAASETTMLKNALIVLECVKVLLLRLHSLLPLEKTTGVPTALASLVVRYAIAVHAALPNHLSHLANAPGLCDIDPSSPTYAEMFEALDECCTTYTIKSDGARFRDWCDAAVLRTPLRSLHTSFFIFLMDCGRFAPRLEEAHLRTSASERLAVGSPLVQSRSMSLAEVLLVTLEHALAHRHSSSAGYVRMFPVRHGMDSGYYIAPTEQLVIALADLSRLELQCRSELLMEEAFRRQDVALEEITGGTTVYPFRPASVPPEVVQRTGVMYESRKKILHLLDQVCPDRYPITESWLRIAPLERYPELMACHRELMAAEPFNALLLRAATKEVHFRLEWLRVESHHRRNLVQQLTDAIQGEFHRMAEHLMLHESSSRTLLSLQEGELLPRLHLMRCQEEEASSILLHQVVAAAAVTATSAGRDAAAASRPTSLNAMDAAVSRALGQMGNRRFPLVEQVILVLQSESAQRERMEWSAATSALGILLVHEDTARRMLVNQQQRTVAFVACEQRALAAVVTLHQSEICQREIVIRCALASASMSLLHAWRSCPRQHASLASAASRVAAARLAVAVGATCAGLTRCLSDFLKATVETFAAEGAQRSELERNATAERQRMLVDAQSSFIATQCIVEEVACRCDIYCEEQRASCALREEIGRQCLEAMRVLEMRQLRSGTVAGVIVTDLHDLLVRLGDVAVHEAQHRASIEAQEASALALVGRVCASHRRDLLWKKRQSTSSKYLGPQQGYSRTHAVSSPNVRNVAPPNTRDELSGTPVQRLMADSSAGGDSPLSLYSLQNAIRNASHVMCMPHEDDGCSGWSSRSSSAAGASSQVTSLVPSRPESVLTAHSVAFVLDIATTAGSPVAEKLVPHRPRSAKPGQFNSASAVLAYRDSPPRLLRRPHSAVTISRSSPLRSPVALHEHCVIPVSDGDDTVFLVQ